MVLYKRYERYKDSCDEWIGEIPESWEQIAISRLFELGRGRVISKEEIEGNKGDYPVYSSQTENNGELGRINTFDFDGEYLTWTTDGANAGTVFYRSGKFNCTNVCGTMKPKQNEISLSFVRYALSIQTKRYVRIDINPKLMNNEMSKIRIFIPGHKEQTQIANFLDQKTAEIDSLIADKEKLISLLEEQRQAIITEAVTKGLNPDVKMKDSGVEWIGEIPENWEVGKLKLIVSMKSGNSINNYEIDEFGKYPVYGGNGLRGFTTSYTHDGAFILIGRQGALCGNIHLVEGKFWASEHAVVATLVTKADIRWLAKLLQAMNLNQYSESAAQPGISVDKIKNLYVCIPPISEQEQIANFLEEKTIEIEQLTKQIKDQIHKLKEYRQSLIFEAVTGKIDVRDVAAEVTETA